MTPDRLRIAADSISAAPLVGLAALAAVLEAILGGVSSVLAITVGVLWALDMLGGMARSILIDGVDSLKLEKFVRGVAKAVAVGIALILCALLENIQEEMVGGVHIPLVPPVLVGGVALFAWSILGQVVALWPDFGAHLATVLERWQGSREHTDPGGEA